jgi:hypothetical protein
VGGRILDFFCPSINLGVEVDGDTHDEEVDRIKDAKLAAMGVTVVRFTNADVMTNMEGVLTVLLQRAQSLPLRWPGPALPHPNPSPEGEGLASCRAPQSPEGEELQR